MKYNINLNGPSGGEYMSHSQAVANGMTHTAKYSVERKLDAWYLHGHYGDPRYKASSGATVDLLLSSAIWSDKPFNFYYPVENGTYKVLIYTGENYKDYHKNFSINVEGQRIFTIQRMKKGEYAMHEATVDVTDGKMTLEIAPYGGSEMHLMNVSMVKLS